MAEPHASGAVVLGVSVSLVGTVFGAQLDALIIALAASICVSMWLRAIDTYPRVVGAVLMSGMCGAYLSPFAADLGAAKFGLAQGDPLRLACALLLGGAAPLLVPVILRRGQRVIEGGAQ